MTLPTWWAKIDNEQVVDLIIVNGDIDSADFTSNLDGVWIESPEAGPWAIMGGFYDSIRQEFYAPQPFPSWILDANNVWQPPTPKPTDGKDYAWYEAEQRWALVVG
jgi:hypothetical protein